jgi:hypothetical protein
MLDQNYALHINRSLSGDTGSTTSGSDSFTPGSVGLNAPDWFPASAGVGVDLDVIQRASLQLDGLQGQLQAIHRDSGTVRSASFSELGAADSLHFDLGLAGTWDFSFQQVSMLDTFNTRFSMGATAYAQYRIGFNCGDLGTDSDNGFGCGGDGRVDNTLADVSLFSLPGQRLGTQALSSGTVFSVDVLAAPVPEPGTWALMLAGVGAVALRQQRLRRALER